MARATPKEQRLAVSLYRLLSDGKPVAPARLGAEAGVDSGTTRSILSGWSNVDWDGEGNVVAFGLSLRQTRHRLMLGARTLYTWCAWDTLFLPVVLGRDARVESTAPRSAERVRLTVSRDGVGDVRLETTVLSFVPPPPSETDLIANFCNHVHFFATPEAAAAWAAEHQAGFLLSVEEGFELGRRWASSCFGAALPGDG